MCHIKTVWVWYVSVGNCLRNQIILTFTSMQKKVVSQYNSFEGR